MNREETKERQSIHVVLHYPEKRREISYSRIPTATDLTERRPKHQWIECMDDFRQLLFTAEENWKPHRPQKLHLHERKEPIVVALIDDGIDVKELELENYGSITGRSFCPRPHYSGRTVPHYFSSGGHGTVMASQIHRICPKVELYVLKLEDRIDPESGKRQIEAKSAAQVCLF